MNDPSPSLVRLQSQPSTADVDDQWVQPPSVLKRSLAARATWVLLVDVGLVLVFGVVSQDHVFWSTANAQSLLLNGTEALLLALALTMLLGAGVFDLSVGSNLVLSSVVGATVMTHVSGGASGAELHSVALAACLGAVSCLATGLLYGLINGLVVGVLGINSLIATLATLGIGYGTALLITNGTDVAGLPTEIQSDFGLVTVAGVPLPALFALIAAASLWGLVKYTRYGMRTLAIGSSRVAAERAAIRVDRQLVSLMALAGLFAGSAGFIDLAHFTSTSVAGHANDALAAITAVVIGGTLLQGGRISVIGTVWGTVLAVVLQSGLVIIGVPSFYQLIVVGVVLIAAVAVDQFSERQRDV